MIIPDLPFLSCLDLDTAAKGFESCLLKVFGLELVGLIAVVNPAIMNDSLTEAEWASFDMILGDFGRCEIIIILIKS